MRRWRSAKEISAEFAVGEARLLAFSARGNLPMRQSEGRDEWLFDARVVASLFPRRGSAVLEKARDTTAQMARLGGTCLGVDNGNGGEVAPLPRGTDDGEREDGPGQGRRLSA